jgi:hypothetical protein
MGFGRRHTDIRSGFTYLELEVAFLLFAIALSGLVPLAVVQSRQARKIEGRLDPQQTHYLAPSPHGWARKLGAGAAIRATASPSTPDPVMLIDDGDSLYHEQDQGIVDWHVVADSAAFAGDYRHNDGRGNAEPFDKAIWTFSDLRPGAYDVFVTYPPKSDAANNTPYRVYSDGQLLLEVRVDQQTAPSGDVYQGVPWENLGTVNISQTELIVELHDDADGEVYADAVRLVPRRNEVQVVSISKSMDQEAVSAAVTVTSP